MVIGCWKCKLEHLFSLEDDDLERSGAQSGPIDRAAHDKQQLEEAVEDFEEILINIQAKEERKQGREGWMHGDVEGSCMYGWLD